LTIKPLQPLKPTEVYVITDLCAAGREVAPNCAAIIESGVANSFSVKANNAKAMMRIKLINRSYLIIINSQF
jgi:hypothetical protein